MERGAWFVGYLMVLTTGHSGHFGDLQMTWGRAW